MVQVSYPGVYVQEVPSGVRTIVGVSTSVALFLGRTKQGLLDTPILCFNYSDFDRAFSSDSSLGDMARYVKLFFLNGGTQCYVMRIAHGASAASVTLQNEAGAPQAVLILTAKQAGLVGENVRALVTYAGPAPEATFNLDLFRWDTDSTGRRVQRDAESWKNLSMDPNSPLYAPTFLTQNSQLVNAAEPNPVVVAAGNGFSQSGRPVLFQSGGPNAATFRDGWAALLGQAGPAKAFQISVDGQRWVTVDLSGLDVAGLAGPAVNDYQTQLGDAIAAAIATAYTNAGVNGVSVAVSFEAGPNPGPGQAPLDRSTLLRITSNNKGDVLVRPAGADDAALPLMLGTAQGGLEVSAHAARRPAPNGMVSNGTDTAGLSALMALHQDAFNQVRLPAVQADGTPTTANVPVDLQTTNANDPLFIDNIAGSPDGNRDGLREKLGVIRDAINGFRQQNPRTFFWRAEVWGDRLAILPTAGDDNAVGTIAVNPAQAAFTDSFLRNVRYYSVGVNGTAGRQTPAAVAASDGSAPTLSDYDAAYQIADREVDLFNLMLLPPDAAPAQPMSDVYGPASVFCQERRAFLLMDPPTAWRTAQQASTGVDALRIGLVKDYSALFFPRLVVNDNGLQVKVGPSGAIAGLMARIDSTRGVWKAPAGTEADLRGVTGLEYRLSDQENGVLNPRAVNTIRVFPNGIVNWGARTMDGDDNFGSEYKYIPIRRLALFMEESLYRGLKWVVFEPNDEPLWAQIRLNVGAFMHDLFRKGAFQGQKPSEAYFVKCDAETTTQNDRDLGIVNIWVGFAPLKPAEFVVLYLQQMAGQIQV